ncbi:hypothetical protein [Rubrivirga sp. IMCC45206]|uniref:hypothetical protein n=1 Tax=Rubrivirga sp. IMCC45206 TaxID=3391614 RepID=UPI0039901326
MFSGDRGLGTGDRGARALRSAGLLAALLTGSGCSTVLDAAAGVFGPGEIGGAVDAHVVYRLRPDCPTLLARTMDHGYTVLRPLDAATAGIPEVPGFEGGAIEESGVFEGPVRTGEVVFRYVPPAASQTWATGPVDVVADVDAVELDLPTAHRRMLQVCGPLPADTLLVPDPTIPRVPAR